MLIVNPNSTSTAELIASIKTVAAKGGTPIATTASIGLTTLSLLSSDYRLYYFDVASSELSILSSNLRAE
jgi:hypothetical protein